MSKFFTAADFFGIHLDGSSDYFIPLSKAVELANAKLMREGKIVLGDLAKEWREEGTKIYGEPSYQALLINIEPVEQKLDTSDMDKHKDTILDKANKLREIFGNTPEMGDAYNLMVKQVCTKKLCTHPKEKVVYDHVTGSPYDYSCECGAKVSPKEFEEVK